MNSVNMKMNGEEEGGNKDGRCERGEKETRFVLQRNGWD